MAIRAPARACLAPPGERLSRLPDITVGAIHHPQSNLVDFYREMGDIFAVPLQTAQPLGWLQGLARVWFAHLETTRRRAVLLVDEAQEMSPPVRSASCACWPVRVSIRSRCCVWCWPAMRV
jgi:general secretion pathway protein A